MYVVRIVEFRIDASDVVSMYFQVLIQKLRAVSVIEVCIDVHES